MASTASYPKSDTAPTAAELKKIGELPILDADGEQYPFKSLWQETTPEGKVKGKTVMLIFIRHFFCGVCQEYITHLSRSLPADLPIAVIGCGETSLINFYKETTQCSYPIYADPTRDICNALGFHRTLAMGDKSPDYLKRTSMSNIMVKSLVLNLKEIWTGRWNSGGDWKQLGGEFLFVGGDEDTETQVQWCHRMQHTRDHAESDVVKAVLDAALNKAPTPTNSSEERLVRPATQKRLSWMQRTRRSISLRRSDSRSRSATRAKRQSTISMASTSGLTADEADTPATSLDISEGERK